MLHYQIANKNQIAATAQALALYPPAGFPGAVVCSLALTTQYIPKQHIEAETQSALRENIMILVNLARGKRHWATTATIADKKP